MEECPNCGGQFELGRVAKDGIVGCSKVCRFQLRNGPRNCNQCGKEYWPKQTRSKVCSRQCSGRASQSKDAREARSKTVMEKYGVDSVFKSDAVKDKIDKTVNKRYGGKGLASPEIRKKNEATNLERYGVINPFQSEVIKSKIKQDNLEKYGVEYSSQRPEVREKIEDTNMIKYGVKVPLQNEVIMNKLRDTNLERYGVEYSIMNEVVKSKARDTMIDRYGVSEPFRSEEILEKIRDTNMKNYGVDNPFKSEIVKQQIRNTNLERYGAENFSNRSTLDSEIEARDEHVVSLYESGLSEYEIADMLGYEYITIRRILLRSETVMPNNLSQANKYWAHKIKRETGIEFSHEGKIFTDKRSSVDLYNNEFKIAIDINPTITHSTQDTPYPNRKTTPIRYHQDRGIDASDNGWELIQIFDWDNEEDIIELLKSKFKMNSRIFARKCVVKEISHKVSKEFLDDNHRQEGKVNSSIQYGLFKDGKLIQVMTFSKERFSRDRQEDSYELLRLTSQRGITVVGGASKLFKAFTRSSYRPKSVKTFADFSKGSGSTYENLDMVYEGFANLNALYANIHNNKSYKVTEVTNKYKKEYDELGLTQKEFMNSRGYYRITDAGHKVFRWRLDES